MASQVTVIGPSARRHTVKTTPGTYLSDVHQQACAKMNVDPSQYGLKHNTKLVDLSRTMRLSGLTSGAKLELTLLSRSPSAVSVALQLPGGNRLLDKFSSSTTLWLILRKFESGVAGGGTKENLTARGVPKKADEKSGAGRLYHEKPVLQIMGRDYTNFTDLQKTLGQIGFNHGSVLLKLSFQPSEVPLEEAMAEMEQYFSSIGAETLPAVNAPTKPAETAADVEPEPRASDSRPTIEEATRSTAAEASADATDNESTTITTISNRPTSIYRPPTSSTPQAAQTPHNPSDYVPSVEHARVHQAGLLKASQNQRLLTDAELAQQASERAARRASISSVIIKARFPDESSAVAPFSPNDTAEDLYSYVEGLLRTGSSQPFEVAFAGSKGKVVSLPRTNQKLISQIGLEGKVLVQVRWSEGASAEARRGPSLKEEVANLGRAIEIAKVPDVVDEEEDSKKGVGKPSTAGKADNSGNKEKGKGVPKWFKMGKK